ncbi:TPA: hypothetical protein ACS3J5_000166 [Klebsiella michiganensis]|uniref:hypothetical protein n=1 Tax=Klebsiella michiganensis TaxID=1134687 RepID=UPI0018C475AA|nr:hypothetical protein [Klebsiella michiganensis]MBG2624791.1 hypothetical protein [Klebsiella michiganensis]
MSYTPYSIHVGAIIPTNNCGDIRVVEYKNINHVVVQFINTGYIKLTRSSSIRAGKVEDRMKPTLLGVGCLGDGGFPTRVNGKETREYSLWANMLKRVYGSNPKYASYKGCTVHPSWLNYSSFCASLPNLIGYAEWRANEKEFHLDKDILWVGNREYGPFTCMFVDAATNSLESSIRRWRIEHVKNTLWEAA